MLTMFDIAAAFKGASQDQLRELAEDLAPFVYDTSRVFNDVRDDRKIRITSNGSDVKDISATSQLKYPGESYFDHLDIIGGSVQIESRTRGREVNIRVGAGADCMFDILVSSCFATLPGFVSGQTFTSLSGCTFVGFATVFAAGVYAGTLSAGDDITIFVCRGVYTDVATIPMTDDASVTIIGSGIGNTVMRPGTGSGTVLAIGAQTGKNNIVSIRDMTFDTTSMGAGSVALDFAAAGHFKVDHCRMIAASVSHFGLTPAQSEEFASKITHCTFAGLGIGIAPTQDSSTLIIDSNEFLGDLAIGVRLNQGDEHVVITSNVFFSDIGVSMSASLRHEMVVIDGNEFRQCLEGIKASSSSGSGVMETTVITSNMFYDCAEGIDIASAAGDISGFIVNGNTFRSISDVAIRLNTLVLNSVITDNTFISFTANNEIVGLTAAQALTNNVTIGHNKTDSGAVLPDTHAGELGFTGSGGFPTKIIDADGDTYVAVENNADEDIIRFGAASSSAANERARVSSTNFDLLNALDFRIYSDDATTLKAQIDGATGHLGIGTAISTLATINVVGAFTDPSGTSSAHALTNGYTFTGNSTSAMRGLSNTMNIGGTGTLSGTTTANALLQTAIGNGNTVTLNELEQVYLLMSVGSGSTVVDRYGVRINDATGSGSLTNQYGLYIANMAKGGTINRAIQSLGGISTHLGAMRFGSNTAPSDTTNGAITVVRANVLTGGHVRFYDADDSNYVGIRAPATAQSENWVIHLPDDDPTAGQVLSAITVSSPDITTGWVDQTGGSGTYDWGKTLAATAGALFK